MSSMEWLVETVGVFFSQAFTWVSRLITTVSSSSVLMVLVFAIPIVGFAVGLLKRLIHL